MQSTKVPASPEVVAHRRRRGRRWGATVGVAAVLVGGGWAASTPTSSSKPAPEAASCSLGGRLSGISVPCPRPPQSPTEVAVEQSLITIGAATALGAAGGGPVGAGLGFIGGVATSLTRLIQ